MEKKSLKGIINGLKNKRISTVAGAWVFYFLTGLLPVVFLLITAFSIFGVSLYSELVGRLPEEFREAGEALLKTAEKASKGITFFFIITVLFSGSRLLNQMSKDGEYIYGVKLKGKRGILRRLWAVLALIVLFCLFLFTAFLFAFRGILSKGIFLNRDSPLFAVAFFCVLILISYAVIIFLNGFISPVKLKFSTLLVGSFVSLSVIVLGTISFIVYVRFFHAYNAFYGSLAGIIVFILWAYILMTGLVLGASVSNVLNRQNG